MSVLETYVRALREIHFSGAAVPETSYYGAMEGLFNEVGKTLKPRVRCILNPANKGAGIPDGGLYTADQFQRDDPQPGQTPARGVIEAKGMSADVHQIARGEQVQKYLARYGLVLVTNFHDFLLMGRDAMGAPALLEPYHLAENEAAFWAATASPRAMEEIHGQRFTEYLRRVMLHNAPLAAPEDVARFLASYARDALARVEHTDLSALTELQRALEKALGITFTAEKGAHFFRSTLVQTLFYGVFSAWVLWSKEHPPSAVQERFEWRNAAWSLHVPIIRALFHQIADPSRLKPLGLVEVLDWTGAVLNRVDRAAFFARFEEGSAVQYFYEPFLREFDPELRKDLGVWYTPPEIVQYMVARVDAVLREELGLADGLADPNVYILDPCCGTGAYLVEVLRRIDATLREHGDALSANDLKLAAMQRVFGFEILPAPFVVAHLQLGLLLQNLGAPLADQSDERAGVFLTNALTGWEKGAEQLVLPGLPELQREAEDAARVKRDKPILVILGNPPYDAFAGVSPKEENELVEPYKAGLISEWGIKKFNLDDLYVRFFRLAERRITEGEPGRGVVSFISNFSYLSDPSYVVMRQRFLSEFDSLWFDSMNGDSRETGKLTPEGKPDPSVFSTEYNREGIRVGTAISLMVRKANRSTRPTVRFRQFWGVTKRADLLASLKTPDFAAKYAQPKPVKENRFSLKPAEVSEHYMEWPKLIEIAGEGVSNGLMEKRGGALIDIDRSALEKRMRMYYDRHVGWEELAALKTGLTEDAAGYEAERIRPKIQNAENFQQEHILRYALRPFDTRWCYYSDVNPLWNRSRPALRAQYGDGNAFLMCRPAAVADPEGTPFYFTSLLGDNDFLRGHAYYFSLQIRSAEADHGSETHQQAEMFAVSSAPKANLSPSARAYLATAGISNPDADRATASLIWLHALAIGYAPSYLIENKDGVRQDWPRIPLPAARERLQASAALGEQIAALLDAETPVPAVTAGAIRPELRSIGSITHVDGRAINPAAGELAVTAGWGYGGNGNPIMPGRGKVVARDYMPDELAAITSGAAALGLTPEAALAHLGATTCDVYLNDTAFWRNVPARVWEYTIGGYQVVKKWLSYRERGVLGRDLTPDEAREVTHMARRIAAILLLEPQLDANYAAVKAATSVWPHAGPTP